jgi:hypothetical protein
LNTTANNTLSDPVREALEAAIGALEDVSNAAANRRDTFPKSSEYHFEHALRSENARRHVQALQRLLREKRK